MEKVEKDIYIYIIAFTVGDLCEISCCRSLTKSDQNKGTVMSLNAAILEL